MAMNIRVGSTVLVKMNDGNCALNKNSVIANAVKHGCRIREGDNFVSYSGNEARKQLNKVFKRYA